MQKNKLLYLAIALVAAVCFWFYVVTEVNNETDVTISNVKVSYSGAEDLRDNYGLILTEKTPDVVTVKFHGNRADLKKLVKRQTDLRALVDVSQIRSEGEYSLIYTVQLPASLQGLDLTMPNRTPNRIQFSAETLTSRSISVKGVFNGTVSDEYLADGMTFNYDTITIQGPEDVIDLVQYAQVIMEKTGLVESVTEELPYTLVDGEGASVPMDDITAEVQRITATLHVVGYQELELLVDLLDDGTATDYTEFEVSPKFITVSGDPATLRELDNLVIGNIDVSKAVDGETFIFPILLPSQLKNISGEEEATVTLHIDGLSTKEFHVSDIVLQNLPDKLKAEAVNRQITVSLRGTREALAAVREENLHAIADLGNLTKTGTLTVPVTITVDGAAKVGIVGEYTIVVTVTK